MDLLWFRDLSTVFYVCVDVFFCENVCVDVGCVHHNYIDDWVYDHGVLYSLDVLF